MHEAVHLRAWGRTRAPHEAVHVRCMRPFTSLRIFLNFSYLNSIWGLKAVCIWMHIVRKEFRSWIHYHKQRKLTFIALEWKCYKRTRAISRVRLYPVGTWALKCKYLFRSSNHPVSEIQKDVGGKTSYNVKRQHRKHKLSFENIILSTFIIFNHLVSLYMYSL